MHVPMRAARSGLHITNGDATVPGLRGTGLAREILPWRDVLHEGPVPDVPRDELRRFRAAFLAGVSAREAAAVEREMAERDRTVAEHRDGAYVLWFEADLYDQLQIVEILARLRQLEVPPERVTLVCVGEHPGIARFAGLGQLGADQLRRLRESAATTLSPAALELAERAWRAFRAPDPAGLAEVVASVSPELRFLGEAFDRLGREYPSTRDGLALSERRILAAVADGAATAGAAFVRAAAREARPFLGDSWAFERIRRLRHGDAPLLDAAPAAGAVMRDTGVRITAAGRRVLAGEDDHVALNGVDRWIGGVRLSGRSVPWRWDDGVERVAVPSVHCDRPARHR